MNPSYDNSFGSFQQPVVSAQGGNFQQVGERKSRKWIIILIILVVIAIGLFAVVMINRNSGKGSAESIETSYWTYMNYLIKGEDSSEVLLEEDYLGLETAIRENYDRSDESYFNRLMNLFTIFKNAILSQPEDIRYRYNETLEDYEKSLNMLIKLETTNSSDDNEDSYLINQLLQQGWGMERIVRETTNEESE